MNSSQHDALKTWYPNDGSVPVEEQLNQAMLQLASEAGELVGLWAKSLYKPGRTLDRDMVIDELGDIWYYVRIIAWLYGITVDQLSEFNAAKLAGGHGWNGAEAKVQNRLNGG